MGLGLTTSSFANTTNKKITLPAKVCTTIDQQKVFFYADVINESIKVIYIADTHLFKDDNRGVPYQEYSTDRINDAFTTHPLMFHSSGVPVKVPRERTRSEKSGF